MAILRLPAVRARTGLSRATIYRKMQACEFPKPHQLSQRAVGWLESDINAWIANCIARGLNDR
ncbi:AlpA family transcriptional regulator [Sphingobium sp. BYY-5]|nr:AlpA family transcriptional regulator [Sphingobium sp. BYY-5]MCI4591478.1 AlpA family transcriptional regulator [Sphingobium sp. BYY-5]